MFKIFATCHCVYMIDDEMQGDILDIKVFLFSGYKIIANNNSPNVAFGVELYDDEI